MEIFGLGTGFTVSRAVVNREFQADRVRIGSGKICFGKPYEADLIRSRTRHNPARGRSNLVVGCVVEGHSSVVGAHTARLYCGLEPDRPVD